MKYDLVPVRAPYLLAFSLLFFCPHRVLADCAEALPSASLNVAESENWKRVLRLKIQEFLEETERVRPKLAKLTSVRVNRSGHDFEMAARFIEALILHVYLDEPMKIHLGNSSNDTLHTSLRKIFDDLTPWLAVLMNISHELGIEIRRELAPLRLQSSAHLESQMRLTRLAVDRFKNLFVKSFKDLAPLPDDPNQILDLSLQLVDAISANIFEQNPVLMSPEFQRVAMALSDQEWRHARDIAPVVTRRLKVDHQLSPSHIIEAAKRGLGRAQTLSASLTEFDVYLVQAAVMRDLENSIQLAFHHREQVFSLIETHKTQLGIRQKDEPRWAEIKNHLFGVFYRMHQMAKILQTIERPYESWVGSFIQQIIAFSEAKPLRSLLDRAQATALDYDRELIPLLSPLKKRLVPSTRPRFFERRNLLSAAEVILFDWSFAQGFELTTYRRVQMAQSDPEQRESEFERQMNDAFEAYFDAIAIEWMSEGVASDEKKREQQIKRIVMMASQPVVARQKRAVYRTELDQDIANRLRQRHDLRTQRWRNQSLTTTDTTVTNPLASLIRSDVVAEIPVVEKALVEETPTATTARGSSPRQARIKPESPRGHEPSASELLADRLLEGSPGYRYPADRQYRIELAEDFLNQLAPRERRMFEAWLHSKEEEASGIIRNTYLENWYQYLNSAGGSE